MGWGLQQKRVAMTKHNSGCGIRVWAVVYRSAFIRAEMGGSDQCRVKDRCFASKADGEWIRRDSRKAGGEWAEEARRGGI